MIRQDVQKKAGPLEQKVTLVAVCPWFHFKCPQITQKALGKIVLVSQLVEGVTFLFFTVTL